MTTQRLYSQDDVVLAPLSGYTDLAFRAACRRCGLFYAFAPLIDAGSLVYRNSRNASLLARGEDEPWLGVQVLGADPDRLAEAARRLSGRGFDVLDLNLGCPVPKVTKRGAGAALGLNRDLAARCVQALVANCDYPVTAKIRILSRTDPAPTVDLAVSLQEAGIQALTIHGREWEQIYSGLVAFDVIRAVGERLRIPVIANGGVFDRDSATELRRRTGRRLVMVARGAIGNPWIFRELRDASAPPPTHDEVCAEVERHVLGMVAQYGEPGGMRAARKIILAYLKGRGYRRKRRDAVARVSTLSEFREQLTAIRREGPSPHYNPDS